MNLKQSRDIKIDKEKSFIEQIKMDYFLKIEKKAEHFKSVGIIELSGEIASMENFSPVAAFHR